MCITWGISFCSVSTLSTKLLMVCSFMFFSQLFQAGIVINITTSFTVCLSTCAVWKEINFTLLLYLQQQWKRISKCGRKWKEVLSTVRSVVYVQRLTWIQTTAVCVTQPSTGARMNDIRKLVQNTSRYTWFCLELMYKIQFYWSSFSCGVNWPYELWSQRRHFPSGIY